MDKMRIKELENGCRDKSTDELLKIWTANDRKYWSAETFEAIRTILRERGITLPPQVGYKTETSVTSKLAVASLVFGLLGVIGGCSSPLAIIFGHMASSRIRYSGGNLKGIGMARTGLIFGYCCFFILLPCLLLFPTGRNLNEHARYTEAISALGAIQTKIKVYQVEKGKLPSHTTNGAVDYITQKLVGDSNQMYGVDDNGGIVPGTVGMSPFQQALEIGFDEYSGKFFKNDNYLYRIIDSSNDKSYAYLIAAIGSGGMGRGTSGTGSAVFTRHNGSEHITATWVRYRAEDNNTLVLTTNPTKPWHIPVPTFDMSVELIRKLGWTVD